MNPVLTTEIDILRGHTLKLHAQQSRLDVRKFSFAVRVVKPWNFCYK